MRSFSPFEWRRIASKNDTNLLITRKLRSKPVLHYGKYCGYVMPNVGILKKSAHIESDKTMLCKIRELKYYVKIKHYLGHENKVNKNKVLYCEALRYM